MKAIIRYRVSDGALLEANFGDVGVPAEGEAIIQADYIPKFEIHKVVDGTIVERAPGDIDPFTAARLAEVARLSTDKTAWLAQNWANKTPVEIQVLVEARIASITTLAQAKSVLGELLPIMAWAISALAHQTLER